MNDNGSGASALTLGRIDLAAYAAGQHASFTLAWHIDQITRRLEAVDRGEISRLIVCMPPGHGKTTLCSQLFPAWALGRDPSRRIILTSYSQNYAEDNGRAVLRLLNSGLHSAIFPESRPAPDSSAAHHFETTAGGAVYAVGRGGSITGRHANIIVVDDPLENRQEAESETIRAALIDWFRWDVMTRLLPRGAIIVVMTRRHELDLVGWLLRERTADGWTSLVLPALAETDDRFRRTGEALWPEQFSVEDLKKKRDSFGPAAFEGLFQQRPVAPGGNLFRRAWFRMYRDRPSNFGRIVQSWDCGFKTGQNNSYSVCTTWGEGSDGYYLIHMFRDRCEFPELKRKVRALDKEFRPTVVLIEDEASGQSVAQELGEGTKLPIVRVRVDGKKARRAELVTALFESGKVFLPEGAPLTEEFVTEHLAFPNGARDDIVDSTSQALRYMRDNSAHQGLTESQLVDLLKTPKRDLDPYARAEMVELPEGMHESGLGRGPGPLTLPPGRFGGRGRW